MRHPSDSRPACKKALLRNIIDLLLCIALASLFVLLSSGAAFGQGNVGINNPTPHSKSLLDLISSDKGLLATRVTTVQRRAMLPIADATAKGMLVYQTDVIIGFYYHDGTSWVMLQSGNAGWGLPGNGGPTRRTWSSSSKAIEANGAMCNCWMQAGALDVFT